MSTQNPAEQHHRIDSPELPVIDLAAAKRFPGAAFGLSFEDQGPGSASFHEMNSPCGASPDAG